MGARDLGKLKTWAQAVAAGLGGLAAGGAFDDDVAWWALPRRARPHLGLGPRLRPHRSPPPPWPAACVASAARTSRRVLELSRRALGGREEQVGNPLWATRDELESELSDWDAPPEETLLVDVEEDGAVVGFGGVEVAAGFAHADLFGPLVAPGFRGQKLGTRAARRFGRTIAVEHGGTSVVGSVGPRNTLRPPPARAQGFAARGRAQGAVFRLAPRSTGRGRGARGIEVRRGEVNDLEPALVLYHATFPEGRFPDDAWRNEPGARAPSTSPSGRARRSPSSTSTRATAGPTRSASPRSERSRGVGRTSSPACSRTTGRTTRRVARPVVEADNVPALRLLRRQGFAPWLVLQSYELWL